jgi:hypothetical protein
MIVAPPGQDFFHFKIWKDIKILGEGRPFVSQCQGLLGNEQLSKTIWFILDLHLLKIFFLIARNFKFGQLRWRVWWFFSLPTKILVFFLILNSFAGFISDKHSCRRFVRAHSSASIGRRPGLTDGGKVYGLMIELFQTAVGSIRTLDLQDRRFSDIPLCYRLLAKT